MTEHSTATTYHYNKLDNGFTRKFTNSGAAEFALIEKVRPFPSLWNPKDGNYLKRHLLDKIVSLRVSWSYMTISLLLNIFH